MRECEAERFWCHSPKSFTSIALLFLRPVSWTVVSLVLAIGVPSLPLVTLRRYIEKREASAIFWWIWLALSSAFTVMVSGRFLIGRPALRQILISETPGYHTYHEGAQQG